MIIYMLIKYSIGSLFIDKVGIKFYMGMGYYMLDLYKTCISCLNHVIKLKIT